MEVGVCMDMRAIRTKSKCYPSFIKGIAIKTIMNKIQCKIIHVPAIIIVVEAEVKAEVGKEVEVEINIKEIIKEVDPEVIVEIIEEVVLEQMIIEKEEEKMIEIIII
jgi:hypothetical protein